MTSVTSKVKSLSQKQLWLALMASFIAVVVLSDIYAGTVLLNEAILASTCQAGDKTCLQIRDIVLVGIPYLFLMPGFYFTIQLVRSGGWVSKVLAWLCLVGQILLLPVFWMLLFGMALAIGLARNGGPSF
jgi:hypothetical protein